MFAKGNLFLSSQMRRSIVQALLYYNKKLFKFISFSFL